MLASSWKATKPEQQFITDIISAAKQMEKIKLDLGVGTIALRIPNAKYTGGSNCLPSLGTSHQLGVGNGREGSQCWVRGWQEQKAVPMEDKAG